MGQIHQRDFLQGGPDALRIHTGFMFECHEWDLARFSKHRGTSQGGTAAYVLRTCLLPSQDPDGGAGSFLRSLRPVIIVGWSAEQGQALLAPRAHAVLRPAALHQLAAHIAVLSFVYS